MRKQSSYYYLFLICFVIISMPVSFFGQMLNEGREFAFALYPDHPGGTVHFELESKDSAIVNFHFYAEPTEDFSVSVLPGEPYFVEIPWEVSVETYCGHIDGMIDNRSLQICSDRNIMVRVSQAEGVQNDGTLLYPVFQPFIISETDTFYAMQPGYPMPEESLYPSGTMIVSHYDGVELEVLPTYDIADYAAYEPFTITLNRGEVFPIGAMHPEYFIDFDPWNSYYTGTRIRVLSTPGRNPVSVFASSDPLYIAWPLDAGACCADALVEQLLPTYTNDTLYHLVPYMLFTEDLPDAGVRPMVIKALSYNNDNNIYMNGTLVATLEYGETYDTILDVPSILRSTYPVSLHQFVTSQVSFSDEFTWTTPYGDPDQILTLSLGKQGVKESIFSIFPYVAEDIELGGLYITTLTLIADSSSFEITLNGEDISAEFLPFSSDSAYKYAQIMISNTETYHLVSGRKVVGYINALRNYHGGISYGLGGWSERSIPSYTTSIVKELNFCDSVRLGASTAGRPPAISYLWSDGSEADSATFYTSGPQWVTSYFSCGSVTDTFHLQKVPGLPAIDLQDTVLCREGDTIRLDAYNEVFTYYQWSTGDTTSWTDISYPGTYTVTAGSEDYLCPPVSDTIDVQYPETLQLQLPEDMKVCEGTIVRLGEDNPNAAWSYKWNTGAGGCCITVDREGYYEVTVQDRCGNSIVGGVDIKYYGCDGCLNVPSAFSPNGDGLNDEFKIITDCIFQDFSLSIYNRWGERVYIGYKTDEGWDGMYSGHYADAGVYFYYIEAIPLLGDSRRMVRKGDLTLIR